MDGSEAVGSSGAGGGSVEEGLHRGYVDGGDWRLVYSVVFSLVS